MTKTTPDLAPFSKLPHHTSKRRFDPLFIMHRTHIHGGSSVESSFELGTLQSRSRGYTNRPPQQGEPGNFKWPKYDRVGSVANLGFRSRGEGAEVRKTLYRRDECQTSRLQ
ncbi:hypothetical protein AVEN_176171-1 [Araneus ventricosus]|uniref:Uncharacterized protein n=1 Tax=Araneus ventricosus TaxID=182803 RepID=A0A4Y2RXR5_ARAVE|nr:hypothetical protein AVEN_176171-1 [Araneus ventricosus]